MAEQQWRRPFSFRRFSHLTRRRRRRRRYSFSYSLKKKRGLREENTSFVN
jgi:hypothetical protein